VAIAMPPRAAAAMDGTPPEDKRAGSPRRAQIREVMERETGFEPATACVGREGFVRRAEDEARDARRSKTATRVDGRLAQVTS
jgi:hypothetical protein